MEQIFPRAFDFLVEIFPIIVLGGFVYASVDLAFTMWRGRKTKRELQATKEEFDQALKQSEIVRAEVERRVTEINSEIRETTLRANELADEMVHTLKKLRDENRLLKEELDATKAKLAKAAENE